MQKRQLLSLRLNSSTTLSFWLDLFVIVASIFLLILKSPFFRLYLGQLYFYILWKASSSLLPSSSLSLLSSLLPNCAYSFGAYTVHEYTGHGINKQQSLLKLSSSSLSLYGSAVTHPSSWRDELCLTSVIEVNTRLPAWQGRVPLTNPSYLEPYHPAMDLLTLLPW